MINIQLCHLRIIICLINFQILTDLYCYFNLNFVPSLWYAKQYLADTCTCMVRVFAKGTSCFKLCCTPVEIWLHW